MQNGRLAGAFKSKLLRVTLLLVLGGIIIEASIPHLGCKSYMPTLARQVADLRMLRDAQKRHFAVRSTYAEALNQLTTPVSFLMVNENVYSKLNYYEWYIRGSKLVLVAPGRDGVFQIGSSTPEELYPALEYDPTNGTSSPGDLIRYLHLD